MTMHKGILGQTEGGASVKTECCGNPLRGCATCPPPIKKELTFAEWYWDGPFGDTIEDSKDKEHFALKVWRAAQENKV